jgi:hypothetical protein
MIGGERDEVVATVRFQSDPHNSGSIECEHEEETNKIPLDRYVKLYIDTECKALPNQDFKFTSWSSIGNKETAPDQSLRITSDGTYTASFAASSFLSSLQFLGPYVSVIILPIIVLIASFPSTFFRFRLLPFKGLKHIPVEKEVDILGVDSAVIAGVLILLTLSNVAGPEQTQLAIITVNIIFPFAISGIAMLLNKKEFAVRMMNAGFVYLIISVILVALIIGF